MVGEVYEEIVVDKETQPEARRPGNRVGDRATAEARVGAASSSGTEWLGFGGALAE